MTDAASNPPPPSPNPRGGADEQLEQRKAHQRDMARRIWNDCSDGVGHHRVAEYLAARGLDVAKLGPVPILRYAPKCYDYSKAGQIFRAPAIVAAYVDGAGQETGVLRIFLDPGGAPKMRDESLGTPRKMIGGCRGRAVRLREEYKGVLLVTVGVENALACMQATGWPAWAYGDEGAPEGFEELKPPSDVLMAQGKIGGVHTVIVAGNLGGRVLKPEAAAEFAEELRGAISRTLRPSDVTEIAAWPGEERAAAAAGLKLWDFGPWLNIIQELPQADKAPSLVRDVGGMAAPMERLERVDWLSVLAAHGEQAVAASLWKDLDVVANQKRSLASLGPLPIPTKGHNAPDGTRAGDDAGGRGGDRPWVEEGGSPRGGAGDDDGGGDKPWVQHASFDDLPIIENGPLEKARRFLWARCRIDGERRFGLCRWGGAWWTYAGGRYVKVSDEEIMSELWQWLNGFRYWKGEGKKKKLLKLTPSSKMVQEVIRALAVDSAARAVQMPARLPALIDEQGRPWWGKASSFAELSARAADGVDPELRDRLVFVNGVLDLAAVARTGRVELQAHSPEIFTATCLPFELDVLRLQRLIGGAEMDDVLHDVCPKFLGWLADAGDGDPDWELQHQEMLGDIISSDRSIEKIHVFVGVKRSGKGYNEDIISALLGEENVAALLLDQIAQDRYATSALVGKAAALAPDAHIGRMAQSAGTMEILKVVSGQGRLPVRDLYQPSMTVRIGARIVLFCNDEPDLKDDSTAFAGRLIFLPLRKSAFGREDESIKKSVRAEAPGIMLYAIMGAYRLAKKASRRIDLCLESQEMSDEFERYSAHLKAFIDDCVDQESGGNVSILPDDLFQCYCWWCATVQERKPLGRGRFFKSVKWHLPKLTQPRWEEDGDRPRRYVGVQLMVSKAQEAKGWAARQSGAGSSSGAWRPDEPDLPM